MLLRGARYRCAVRLARPSAGLATLVLMMALAGCGAAETFATAAPGPAAPGKAAHAAPAPGNRKANEPPEPLPLESSLQMPEVRSVPEPEKPRPALPAPQLQTTPARVVAAAPPPPEAIASVAPEPAPPVPVMADVPPPPNFARPQSRRPAPVVPLA